MAVSRRRFLHAVAVAAAPFAFLARVQTLFGLSGDSVELEPTPAVGEQLELTAQETAGAFFQPDSSLKADFREAGLMGVPTRVSRFCSRSSRQADIFRNGVKEIQGARFTSVLEHTATQAVQVELHPPFWHELNKVSRAYQAPDRVRKCYATTACIAVWANRRAPDYANGE